MIAILGRGIQRLSENGPWVLTEDLEVCDERSAHLPVRVPVNDDNPLCMVGGGEMNLLAGIKLAFIHEPKIVVCAYGARANYLKSVMSSDDVPSESEVMSREFSRAMQWQWPQPEVIVWERHRKSIASNTRQELLNVFDLALEHNLKSIALVTVGVHVPRVAAYMAKHLSDRYIYRQFSPIVFESEGVLLAANYGKYGDRIQALRGSKAFARNWDREAAGISKIIRGVYGEAKPLVEP